MTPIPQEQQCGTNTVVVTQFLFRNLHVLMFSPFCPLVEVPESVLAAGSSDCGSQSPAEPFLILYGSQERPAETLGVYAGTLYPPSKQTAALKYGFIYRCMLQILRAVCQIIYKQGEEVGWKLFVGFNFGPVISSSPQL